MRKVVAFHQQLVDSSTLCAPIYVFLSQDSVLGTIRGDFCIDVGRNVCHGSDSVESARKEIALWFDENELCAYNSHSEDWVYE